MTGQGADLLVIDDFPNATLPPPEAWAWFRCRCVLATWRLPQSHRRRMRVRLAKKVLRSPRRYPSFLVRTARARLQRRRGLPVSLPWGMGGSGWFVGGTGWLDRPDLAGCLNESEVTP